MGVGGFTVVDPRGMQYPYVQGVDWKRGRVERKEPVQREERVPDFAKRVEREDQAKRWQSTLESAHTHVQRTPREGRVPVASDVMSYPVVSLKPNDTLDEAWELVCNSRFRHVPVLDAKRKVVGVVSDRGILKSLWENKGKELLHVKDVMVRNVLVAHPETHVSRIAQVFIDERIGSMPILNKEGDLVGMLTRSDILRVIMQMPSFNVHADGD